MLDIYILHYCDDEIHSFLKIPNYFFNSMMVRCVASVHEFSDPARDRIIILDNGSSPKAHDDLVGLLKGKGYNDKIIWIQTDWPPVSVGTNAAIKDFLSGDGTGMVFLTNDMKIGPRFLQCCEQFTNSYPMGFGEPNLTVYGVGAKENYRDDGFWDICVKAGYTDEKVKAYFQYHGVEFVTDSYGETAPVSRASGPTDKGTRLGVFAAGRQAIEVSGLLDERLFLDCEYQYYDQAIAKGCTSHHLGYMYVPHIGGLYVGSYIGCFSPKKKAHAPDPNNLVYKRNKI